MKASKASNFELYIKKDVINCNVHWRKNIENIDINDNDNGGIFVCPITQSIANGRYPFICIRKCGCILSKKSFYNVPSSECLNCGCKLDHDNIDHEWHYIPINPSFDKKDELRLLTEQKQLKKKDNNKKQKKNRHSNHKLKIDNKLNENTDEKK